MKRKLARLGRVIVVAATAAVMYCGYVTVRDFEVKAPRDRDLTTSEAQSVIDRKNVRIPDSFRLIRMYQHNCPAWTGSCGYMAKFTAKPDEFYTRIVVRDDNMAPPKTIPCTAAAESHWAGWGLDCSQVLETFAIWESRQTLNSVGVMVTRSAVSADIYLTIGFS
ncbi:hypothetical protein ACWIGI_26940 [Nocardia sp. NPDC055321]